nr:unnamed protein product [Spirometra erinaceieuropaei]
MSDRSRQRLTPQEEAVLQAFNNLNARLQGHMAERKGNRKPLTEENRPQPPPVRVFDPANVYAKTTPTLRKASAVRRADPASDRPVLRTRLLPNRTRHLDRGPLAANRRKVFEVPVAAVSNEPTHIFKVSSVLKLLPAWEPCSNSE